MKTCFLVLPVHLFSRRSHELHNADSVVVWEAPRYITDHPFHVQKLVLHRATLSWYYHEVCADVDAVYCGYGTDLFSVPCVSSCNRLIVHDPVDHVLEEELSKRAEEHGCELVVLSNPAFLDHEWARSYIGERESPRMHTFYVQQRRRMDIMVTSDGEPVGGSWSLDGANREPFDPDISIPSLRISRDNDYVREAKAWVDEHFPSAYGSYTSFFYPVTHWQARAWLDDFLQRKFVQFGPYQDAMACDERFLFHSLLSPLLNIGLITPDEVVSKALAYASSHDVPRNSVEGFIRQVIGWREYVAAVYRVHGEKQRGANFFGHDRDISSMWWQGNSLFPPVNAVVAGVYQYAYAHHIERLMVASNLMLLCGARPHAVYAWFMELYIDAYDWVMVPNVYGMGQYADGGLVATKPYISGSSYITKMGDYSCKDSQWCRVWDGLYWYFLQEHRDKLSDNPRCALMYSVLDKMGEKKRRDHFDRAESYLAGL